MSATVMKTGEKPAAAAVVDPSEALKGSQKHYRGFVAGVFSGIAKLSGRVPSQAAYTGKELTAAVGHPFDTVKVRLQTTDKAQFKGPLDCVLQTVRNEGVRGLYKGASPPLVGWMFMDSMYFLPPHPTSHTAQAM